MIPTPSRVAAAAPTGTVVGPVTTVDRQVGRWAVAIAELVLGVGVIAAGVAAFTPARVPLWVLPAVLAVGLGALLGLSRDDPGARSAVTRLRAGLVRAVRPEPVRASSGGRAGRAGRATTRVSRFQLVERSGTRLTCEFVGPARKGAPEPGAVAEVHGRRRTDGTLQVTRVVYAVDGSVFRPRPPIGYALTRLAVGGGTAVGAALLLGALSVLTLRSF